MFEILLKVKLTNLERFFLKGNNKFVLESKGSGKNHTTDSSDPELNFSESEKSQK